MDSTFTKLTQLDADWTKAHPEVLYEGELPDYSDEMDYVNLTKLTGRRTLT